MNMFDMLGFVNFTQPEIYDLLARRWLTAGNSMQTKGLFYDSNKIRNGKMACQIRTCNAEELIFKHID